MGFKIVVISLHWQTTPTQLRLPDEKRKQGSQIPHRKRADSRPCLNQEWRAPVQRALVEKSAVRRYATLVLVSFSRSPTKFDTQHMVNTTYCCKTRNDLCGSCSKPETRYLTANGLELYICTTNMSQFGEHPKYNLIIKHHFDPCKESCALS